MSCLKASCSWQCCRRCPAVMKSAWPRYVSDSPALHLLYMWALSLLCPVLSLDRITVSGLFRLWRLSDWLEGVSEDGFLIPGVSRGFLQSAADVSVVDTRSTVSARFATCSNRLRCCTFHSVVILSYFHLLCLGFPGKKFHKDRSRGVQTRCFSTRSSVSHSPVKDEIVAYSKQSLSLSRIRFLC